MYSAGATNGANPDLGIAVAKKLAKRAVDRNRIKRMIRNLVWAAHMNPRVLNMLATVSIIMDLLKASG